MGFFFIVSIIGCTKRYKKAKIKNCCLEPLNTLFFLNISYMCVYIAPQSASTCLEGITKGFGAFMMFVAEAKEMPQAP